MDFDTIPELIFKYDKSLRLDKEELLICDN